MRLLFIGILAFSTSVELFAASSDYERYGSMAWQNARSNERATDYASRITPNSNYQVTFSQEQIASIARGFQTTPRARNDSYPQPRFSSESPPPPTEEQRHLAAAKAGNAEAMAWLGTNYYSYANDKSVALSWYEAAGRAGNEQGMLYAYAMLMEDRYGLKNLPRALGWLKQLADLNQDPEWASRYAWYLRQGEGVAKDPKLAFHYLLKAATHVKGTGPDRILVAQAYATGDGVEKDPLKAIECYRRLIGPKAEYPAVAVPLTRLLIEFGGGAEKNQAEIAKIFTEFALDEPANAFYYASLKDSGELPPRNPQVALVNYQHALEHAFSSMNTLTELEPIRVAAARRLMAMLLAGDGVPADRVAARAAGLAGLKVGEATFRPLELGYLLIDPALGAPENVWAIKIFDAHSEDLEALRQAAYLTRDTARMEKLVARGDSEAARFMADYERFFAARFDPEGKPGHYRERARTWAEKGAALANLDCLAREGAWLIEDARVTADSAVAATMQARGVAALKQAADGGNPLGMAKFGETYRDGVGAEKNATEAFRWFKKSADGGSKLGKYDLALTLYSGTGAPADKPAALKLAGEAADEIPPAASFYGFSLSTGDCGTQDVVEGVKWMDAALKKDEWRAGADLAKIYHLGSGVPKDEPRARAYLIKAADVGDITAQRFVAEAFEKGEIIDQDNDQADTRFEAIGGGPLALHYLRRGQKKKAARWVIYGNADDPEIIQAKVELDRDLKAKVAAELPTALATLDKNLALLEAAASNFQPTAERKSFFFYRVAYGTSHRERDDDYDRMEQLPESKERALVLGARDAALAGEGDFEAALIAQQGYYGGDPARAPRLLAAVKKIVVADAERGDVDAMDILARLSCTMFSEEYFPWWKEDDRVAVQWCRRAVLAGNRHSVDWIDHFYAEPTNVPKATPKQVAQWKTFSAELAKISDDEPDRPTRIAACVRKFLPMK